MGVVISPNLIESEAAECFIRCRVTFSRLFLKSGELEQICSINNILTD